MNPIKVKLNEVRAELLDLSLRNKLINYKSLKTRGIEVANGSPKDVYRILVQEEKAMSFLPKPDTDSQLQLVEDIGTEEDSNQLNDSRLKTDYPTTELKRRLLNTFYTARTSIEEQGVNTLYLALGMLRWYESEASEIPHHAPLILIPVTLDRANVRAQFRIRYTGEDFGTNLSLQEKLKTEFGIQFPDVPDANDLNATSLQNYYLSVSTTIDQFNRWMVDKSAIALGFFSFAKFLMYRDLDPSSWPGDHLSQHSVLQAVLGESPLQDSNDFPPDDTQIDRDLQPTELHHVVDADSSQALAIHDVSLGRNLVIQGPPGTGKSQTITNLIAAAIAKDKRVLFVAEKMAALEVVKRNLDNVGLGDACLEIHSHKANKKVVVGELKRTLDLEAYTTTHTQRLDQLVENRDSLNRYCEAVNTPIGRGGITPYQAYGELLAAKRRLAGVQIPSLDLRQIDGSTAIFNAGLERTVRLQAHLKQMGAPKDHLFWGSACKIFSPDDQMQMEHCAGEAKKAISALEDCSAQLARELKLHITLNSLDDARKVLCIARDALDAPVAEGIAVRATEWITQKQNLEKVLRSGNQLNQLYEKYESLLNKFSVDVVDETWFQIVRKIRRSLLKLKHSSAQLKDYLRLHTTPDSREEVARMLRVAEYALKAPDMEGIAVEAAEWLTHLEDLAAGLRAGEQLNQLHREYDDVLIPEAWEHNVIEIRKALLVYGSKWWRILSRKYRRARNELIGLCVRPLPKSLEKQLCIVEAIRSAQRELPHLERIHAIGKQLFGILWKGLSSDWPRLQAVTGYLAELHQLTERKVLPAELVEFLSAHPNLDALRRLVSTVESGLEEHRVAACSFEVEVPLPKSLEIQDLVIYTILDEVQQICEVIIKQDYSPERIRELGKKLFGLHWEEDCSTWLQLQSMMQYLLLIHKLADMDEGLSQNVNDLLESKSDLKILQSILSASRAQLRIAHGITEILQMVSAIIKLQRELEKFQQLGRKLFGAEWHGELSNWSQLEAVTKYYSKLHQLREKKQLQEELIEYLATNPDLAKLDALVSTVEKREKTYKHAIKTIVEKIELQEHLLNLGKLIRRPFNQQEQILQAWTRESDKLHEIVIYNHLEETLTHQGFAEIVKVATDWPHANQFLSDVFKHAWYSTQIGKAMQVCPTLVQFSGTTHQQIVDKFRELDQHSLKYNRAQVAHAHLVKLPRHLCNSGHLSVLRNEFFKKRRHLPIRRLMADAGNAIQTIKPIFMMSPLSVAKFLPPRSIDFDWVIFDEASQVEPVDAFGAIIRGKQSIVVGDDKQLPPTRFFNKLVAEDDEIEEENLAGDIESILGLFSRWNAPTRMLRWHYRSRHESLITMSNSEFYENKLQLFPSPDAARDQVGLVFHHQMDTIYDRGKSGKNLAEAKLVAEEVMKHARSRSKLTLGVATFSASQMEAIQDVLESLRREDPSCEETFFNANPEEPFFVKNLENVQGDERDIIFISVGYGRDANGKLKMNFGPLNQDGGERRLNVLITRARCRCELFTNLSADDIDISRTTARGVVALKRYLKYAQTGKLDIPDVDLDKQTDNPFENEVARALRERGYQVDQQVGSAGYFIDLGIKDPERQGRYLLGIECDGATYHSARSARDRDRLRQQILENLDWRIHRIWSTDWFKNPGAELKKTVQAIEVAKVHRSPAPIESSTTNLEPDVIVCPAPEPHIDYFIGQYKLAELDVINGGELHTVSLAVLTDWIQRVVKIESPVHSDEVERRIKKAMGVNRIGKRGRQALEAAKLRAFRSGKIQINESFLYWAQQPYVTVRDRSALPAVSKKLELIASEEIEIAIKIVVSKSLGIERNDLPREVCRLLGFKSVSEDMRKGIEQFADRMTDRGELTRKGDSLVT